MSNRCVIYRGGYRFSASAIVVAVLLFPGYSLAELWRFSPSLTLEERYDDNIKVTSAPHDSVTGTILKGRLGFSRQTEISGVTGKAHINLSDYKGDDELSDDNGTLHLTMGSYYNTELSRWGINGLFKRETTLRSVDISEDVVDEQPDDGDAVDSNVDEGLVDIDVRRYTLKLSPSWNYKFSERTGLQLAYSYHDVRYQDNPSGSGLFNYDQSSLFAGMSHSLTERDTISATLGLVHFQSPDNFDNKANSYDFTIGFKRAFSEIMSGNIDVGVNYTEQESNVFDADTNGFILRLKLNRKTEQKRLILSLSHGVSPSGSGLLTESNELKFKVVHNFTKRLNGSLNVNYSDRDPVGSSSRNSDSFYSIKPKLSWKIDRWWTVTGGYQYRSKENESNVEKADSNAVFLSLSHNKQFTFD